MKTFFRIILALIFIFGAIIGLVVFTGSMMPENHSVTVEANFSAPIDTLWSFVADQPREPSWREDLKAINRVEDSPEGNIVWEEVYENGQTMQMETVEVLAPTRMVRRIYGQKEFGGTWTIVLTPIPEGGTSLSITEDGYVKSAFFRFVMYKIMGEDATIKGYMGMIAKALGEDISFE